MINSFSDRDGVIWFNGSYRKWTESNIHVLNHGLHYASCVFEGIRVYEGKIFKLKEHTERLLKSASILDLDIKYSVDDLIDITTGLISKQNIRNGYIRPVAWRGSEKMAISAIDGSTNLAIAAWTWPSYFSPDQVLKGIKLTVSNWRRPAPNSAPTDSKAAGLYMICSLSKHAAEKKGFDDALMLDYRDFIAEATGANIFFKDKNGEIHTPIPDSFLDGITRRTVIGIAKSKNIKVHERKISPTELPNFVGCFLTGTAAEVTPVSCIAEHQFKVCETIIDLNESYQTLVRKRKAA